MDVKQHSTNQPTHTMHSVAYPSQSTGREMFSCLLGRTVHRDLTRSARDEGGGWEWGGVGGRGGGGGRRGRMRGEGEPLEELVPSKERRERRPPPHFCHGKFGN